MKGQGKMQGGIKERESTFKLTGYTPLLMHNPAQMRQGGGAKTKRIPTPEEEAEAGLYADMKGLLYLKFIAIRNCCLKGGRNYKVGKMTVGMFLGGCILNEDLDAPCYLENAKTGAPLTKNDYEIDTRRAVVQKQGILRSRPKIRDWAARATFRVDTSQIGTPQELDTLILECLNRGGQFIGIGDYRPERTGPFGRFTAEIVNGSKAKKS